VIVSSEKRWVVMHELRGEPEPGLDEQIKRVSPCDLLLVEGYKRYPMPKLEVYREANGKPLLHPEDSHIVAIAADVRLETPLPRFDLGDHRRIAEFILTYNGFR
jgi:molybdopterin-guanine dinucleotide biosynthesis protein B